MSERESAQDRYCRNCGTEIREGTSFCVSCGVPFTQEAVPSDSLPSEPPTSGPSSSFFNSLREQFEGWRRQFSGSSGRATVQGMPNRMINWFRDLPSVPKLIIVGLVLLIPLVLLSPVLRMLAIIALVASVIVLIVQGFQRKPIQRWVIAAVSSLVLIFVFGGISGAIYGTGVFGIGNESELSDSFGGTTDSNQDLGLYPSSISTEEGQYIDQTMNIANETAVLVNSQIELNDQCGGACIVSETAVQETQENVDRMEELWEEGSQITPPEGYEESYEAFLNSWEKRYELLNYLRIGTLEGDYYLNSLMLDGNNYQTQAFELAPPEAQDIYFSNFGQDVQ